MALVGDDCFFFLNSGCVRGSQCTFRHQPAARNTTIVCPQWLQRCCFKPTCVFRHTDDIVTRNQTPCYYETSSGVCWKPRCAFAHVRKPSVPVPLPPPPVLPLRPPVLPAMPPVLPAMPPILPGSVGISAVPHPAPLAANLPLPNNSPVVRAEVPVMVEKPVTDVNTSALPQAVVAPLTTPPPGLPSPPKLTEMLLGTKLPPAVKEAVASPAEKQPRSTASAPTQNVQSGVAPAAVVRKPVAAAAFPKSDHFNEQVRRFKEMLAAKSSQGQKKLKNDHSDDEKGGSSYKLKERQRSKKERREKDGYKSSKSSKATKEKWSKADEEILYGDYKDVPLDRKHKKKKHKEHKEYADSEPEVQVKSYEEILREKALRKLYTRRKEKFNEDFKELVDEKAARKAIVSDKTDRSNDGLPDKVIRKNKRYNSDGGEVESSDDSEPDHAEYRRRYYKSENFEKSKEMKKPEGNHINISDQENSDDHPKDNDIHDSMLKKAIIDSENRQRKRSKKHSKKRKHKEKRTEIDEDVDLIEIHSNGDSKKETKRKSETSVVSKEVSRRSSDSGSGDTESDSDSESEDDKTPSKREEVIIPDETANIDFSVDFDDDLAMEINQTEQSETVSKSKKLISSVVVPINASAPVKNKQKKMVDRVGSDTESSNSSRHHKPDSRSSGRGYSNKQSESKRSSDKDIRRKSPNDSSNNRVLHTEHKKVVRLINTTEQPLSEERASPTISSSIDTNLVETNSTVKNIKVKSFDEIMAEKHKRNTRSTLNLGSERSDVVSLDSPVIAKTINATLKEKSTRVKLEILNVSKEENGHSTSIGIDKCPSRSKILTDEEKQKRKSIQLYKPPHPTKIEGSSAKNTEVKMVVNTGPRKIIRIRKASLSTDLIDQTPPAENVEIASSVNERNDVRETVNVRSFEEIIREKRARQRRERELAQQLEKENSSTVTTVTNNLIRRKPVIRRQVLPSTTSVITSTSSLSKSITTVTTILSTTTTTTSNTNTYTPLNVSETRRTTHSDSNVAKVSPLNVVPAKRIKSDSSVTPALTQAESLENRDFFSRLRNTASRRTSTTSSHSSVKETERTHQAKHRKRSVTSTLETSPVSTNQLQNENSKCSLDNSTLPSDASHETKVEHHGPSRKDIQEALDEKRRKREQDLLSDDEFEKEINELGSDDGDENFDDMDEDDLMMELEQMIDS